MVAKDKRMQRSVILYKNSTATYDDITLQSAIDSFSLCCHAGFFGKPKENSDHIHVPYISDCMVDSLDQAH